MSKSTKSKYIKTYFSPQDFEKVEYLRDVACIKIGQKIRDFVDNLYLENLKKNKDAA